MVATRVGSVSETVLDGRTGYLVAPGDAGEIAGRVIELLRDPQRAAAMGRAGREQVLAHWSVAAAWSRAIRTCWPTSIGPSGREVRD